MKEQKMQNACLMTTCRDENNNTILTYIPLNVDISVVEFFLKNGTCTNNQAIRYEIDASPEKFWETTWNTLLDEEEKHTN